MAALLQSVLILAPRPEDDHPGSWWLGVVLLVVFVVGWIVLSVMNDGDKGSLWKDEGSEMDSGGLGHDNG